MMKVELEGRNPDNVLNMDQMPIPFISLWQDTWCERHQDNPLKSINNWYKACHSHSHSFRHHSLYSKVSLHAVLQCTSSQCTRLQENMHAKEWPGWMKWKCMSK
jgi:hypothetical protein